jgi:hypothetical protein
VRASLTKVVRKYGNAETTETAIGRVEALLEKYIAELSKYVVENDKFKEILTNKIEIHLEFTRAQCKNIIKNIFYRYEHSRKLPLYEKKTLMTIRELYINRLGGNSYASLLLEEMDKWEIDYDKEHRVEMGEE